MSPCEKLRDRFVSFCIQVVVMEEMKMVIRGGGDLGEGEGEEEGEGVVEALGEEAVSLLVCAPLLQQRLFEGVACL